MERMDENTKVIRNQVPQTPPPGTPGGIPRPVRPAGAANNNDNRAIMAAAAVLLGGTLGVGGAIAANAINEEMDDLSATAENNARIADELKEQVEEQQAELDAAKQNLQAQETTPRKVVVIDDDMPSGVRVHSFTHVTGSDGSEMDVAYVTRNGVRGYYVDADHDGIADGFIPENGTSANDIINLREYGETVYMEPMADRVGISYMQYDGSLLDGADTGADVAMVDNPFDGVTTGEVDPTEGPDYTNNANVEGITGEVTDDDGFIYADNTDGGDFTGEGSDIYPATDDDDNMFLADNNDGGDIPSFDDTDADLYPEDFNDFQNDDSFTADNGGDTFDDGFVADTEPVALPEDDGSFLVDDNSLADTSFDAPVIDDNVI